MNSDKFDILKLVETKVCESDYDKIEALIDSLAKEERDKALYYHECSSAELPWALLEILGVDRRSAEALWDGSHPLDAFRALRRDPTFRARLFKVAEGILDEMSAKGEVLP